MTLHFDISTRNALLDFIVAHIGTGGRIVITTTTPTFKILATVQLPNPWMNAASGGQITKTGTWQDLSADATGNAEAFHLLDSGGSDLLVGTVGTVGADMIVDSTSFVAGQTFTINSFTLIAPNG